MEEVIDWEFERDMRIGAVMYGLTKDVLAQVRRELAIVPAQDLEVEA